MQIPPTTFALAQRCPLIINRHAPQVSIHVVNVESVANRHRFVNRNFLRAQNRLVHVKVNRPRPRVDNGRVATVAKGDLELEGRVVVQVRKIDRRICPVDVIDHFKLDFGRKKIRDLNRLWNDFEQFRTWNNLQLERFSTRNDLDQGLETVPKFQYYS